MWKKHKIVVLPTNKIYLNGLFSNGYDKESKDFRLSIFGENYNTDYWVGKNPSYDKYSGYFPGKMYHAYIVSDKNADENCKYYLDGDLIRENIIPDKDYWSVRNYKEIISSTDKSLNLPSPTDEFLKEWVNNPVDEIEVEYKKCSCIFVGDCYNPDLDSCDKKYSLDTTNNTINCRFIQTENSWDNIYETWFKLAEENFKQGIKKPIMFHKWLKENYDPPKTKKKRNDIQT